MDKQKPHICQSYDEARQAYLDGELQAWDGERWEDVPAGSNLLFARTLPEYRRKPSESPTPLYCVSTSFTDGSCSVRQFDTARGVTDYLWGKNMSQFRVFKQVGITSFSLEEIERQLENA